MLKNEKLTRIIELDLLRSLACLMVIFMHTPMDNEVAVRFITNSICYMTAPCIGLFVMVSGALLLPTTMSTFDFIKKRLNKVLFPTLFWSFFYILVNVNGTDSIMDTFKHILSIPFAPQGGGHLWFMYMLIGLYLLTPIFSRWIVTSSEKELRFYLFLWIITLCYPVLEIFLIVNEGITGILYYFSGYLGYFLLGYYLYHYKQNVRWSLLIPLLVVAMITPVSCRLAGLEVDYMRLFWYLSVFVVIMCTFWFKFIMEKGSVLLKYKVISKFVSSFARLSFGIYFVHFYILRNLIWNFDWILSIKSAICQIMIMSSLTILFSYFLCLCISYLPFSEYIIGVKSNIKCQSGQ